MALADDLDFRALAHELISDAGRTVTLGRISKRAADPEKPWKGSGSTEDLEDTFTCDIVQLPDMTLGLIGGSGFGAMGKTGLHSGTHLHFQINKAGATHHKEGLLNTKAWLRGATVGATIPAARGATIASQVSTGVDTTVKAVQNALNTPLETTTATKIASMNAVASAETIRKSAIEKTADEVGAVQPYVPPKVVESAPNLNEGKPDYGIKTPAMPDDKKILSNYLIYMNVLPAEPVYQGMML